MRRDNGEAVDVPWRDLTAKIPEMLEAVQKSLFDRAKEKLEAGIERVMSFDDVLPALNRKHLVLAPWCEDPQSEEEIKKETQRLSELQVNTNNMTEGTEEEERKMGRSTGLRVLVGPQHSLLPFHSPDSFDRGKSCTSLSVDGLSLSLSTCDLHVYLPSRQVSLALFHGLRVLVIRRKVFSFFLSRTKKTVLGTDCWYCRSSSSRSPTLSEAFLTSISLSPSVRVAFCFFLFLPLPLSL